MNEAKDHVKSQIDRVRSVPHMVGDNVEFDEKDLAEAFMPRGVMTSKAPTPTITETVTFRNFANQREMLVALKRKKEHEIESIKDEMRKLNSTYEKLQRELFVIQAKEEATRAAIRSMEDRGVHE